MNNKLPLIFAFFLLNLSLLSNTLIQYNRINLHKQEDKSLEVLIKDSAGTSTVGFSDLNPETEGMASWYNYSLPSDPNYSKTHYTAANRDYPRGTMLRVCNEDWNTMEYEDRVEGLDGTQGVRLKKKCVNVRVNDTVENPNVIIDLSSAAFRQLSPLNTGLIKVQISKLD